MPGWQLAKACATHPLHPETASDSGIGLGATCRGVSGLAEFRNASALCWLPFSRP